MLDAYGGRLPPNVRAVFANTGKEHEKTLLFVRETERRWHVPVAWVECVYRVSVRDRRRDLATWLPRFGHLRTPSLPSHLANLNAQLHEWRRTLAASSCNHRRHALIHLVRLLYGRRAAVDLIDLVRFPPAPPKPLWRRRPRAADARIENPGAPGADALDGNAPVTDGTAGP